MSKNLVSYLSEKNTISVYRIEDILNDNLVIHSSMDHNASDFFMIYDTDEIVCLSFDGSIHSSIHGKLLNMMDIDWEKKECIDDLNSNKGMKDVEGMEDIYSTKGKCTVLSNEGSYWIAIREVKKVSIIVSLKRSNQPTDVSICHTLYYKNEGR